MTDAELDALESYLRGHGTVGPRAADAIAQLRRELAQARALLLAASCANEIESPNQYDWEESGDSVWTVKTESGRYVGKTLNDALESFWDDVIRSRDVNGFPIQESPFKSAAAKANHD